MNSSWQNLTLSSRLSDGMWLWNNSLFWIKCVFQIFKKTKQAVVGPFIIKNSLYVWNIKGAHIIECLFTAILPGVDVERNCFTYWSVALKGPSRFHYQQLDCNLTFLNYRVFNLGLTTYDEFWWNWKFLKLVCDVIELCKMRLALWKSTKLSIKVK